MLYFEVFLANNNCYYPKMWYTCVNYIRFVLYFSIVIYNSNYDNYNANYLPYLFKFDLLQPKLCFRDSWN